MSGASKAAVIPVLQKALSIAPEWEAEGFLLVGTEKEFCKKKKKRLRPTHIGQAPEERGRETER